MHALHWRSTWLAMSDTPYVETVECREARLALRYSNDPRYLRLCTYIRTAQRKLDTLPRTTNLAEYSRLFYALHDLQQELKEHIQNCEFRLLCNDE